MSDRTLYSILAPVGDLDTARSVYGTLLGVAPMADSPHYVGYETNGVHVGLVPNGARQGLTGPTPFWDVVDLEAAVAELAASGATVTQQPQDVGGGTRTAKVADADGNVIGLVSRSA